jgi:hypothetical protein
MPTKYTKNGCLHIIHITGKCRLVPIIRTDEEKFSETIQRTIEKGKFYATINGCWYGLTIQSKIGAVIGNPTMSEGTLNEGIVKISNKLYGNSSPLMYYIAQRKDYTWLVGQGDPTLSEYYETAVGGLCPLIIRGLKFGDGNLYSKQLSNARLTGNPLPDHAPYLIQRNDNKFAGLSKLVISKGKAGFGIKNDGSIVIMVQPDGGQAMSYSSFRDSFINYGCNTAVCSDGSDSVFLTHGEIFLEKAGYFKDPSQTIGIGFKSE